MEQKTRIFIGSSSEGLEVATFVKTSLSDVAECYLWTDNIFKPNRSFFETLLKEASFFDFGILIATKDDFSNVRGEIFEAPRDNVIFEFGLFLGRLGKNRAFILQEDGSKIPTDLLGISVPIFEKTKDLNDSKTLKNQCDLIKEILLEKLKIGELRLLPSTSLAIGYYDNFVYKVCRELQEIEKIEIEGKIYEDFEINVVIPSNLEGDISERVNIYNKKRALKLQQVVAKTRSYPFFIQQADENDSTLRIFDMPTTLSAIDKSIEMYMQKGHIGRDSEQKLLEQRELDNFRLVIQNLIESKLYTRDNVKVISE